MEPSAKYCDKGEMLLRECIKSARYLQRQKTAALETKTRSHRWKTGIFPPTETYLINKLKITACNTREKDVDVY